MFSDRPKPGSWKINRSELDGAVKAIEKEKHVDCTHDVPYTAGYSEDGKELFVDHTMPLKLDGINVCKYIVLHEAVEDALIRYAKLAYLHAHQIALRAERDAVEADGYSWHEYNAAVTREVDRIGAKKVYPNCPEHLDLTPYKDEKDAKTLARMHYED